MRHLVRTTKALVEERPAEENRVSAVLKRTAGRELLTELSLSDAEGTTVEAYLSMIDEYSAQIERIEEKIEQKTLESIAAQRLLSIPDVGQFTAALIVAEIGETDRFDRQEELVSYARLDPMVHYSGDVEVHGSISKESSAQLRWALVQCAHVSVRYDDYLGNFYTRLKRQKTRQIAIVAIARKILVSIFYMLKRQEPYDPPEVSA